MLIIPFELAQFHLVVIGLSLQLELLQINSLDLAVAHHNPSVDDGRFHIAAAGADEQGAERVVQQAKVELAQVNDDHVRFGTGVQTS